MQRIMMFDAARTAYLETMLLRAIKRRRRRKRRRDLAAITRRGPI